jgi:putative SOS response-associated peptidase YedK
MCGRFDTSHLYWRDIHEQLSSIASVATPAVNIEPNADLRPTDPHITARLENGAWRVERMRWGLVPFWRGGKPLKDTAKGAGDGFKLTTFNARVESCQTAATFKDAFERRRCIVPASAWYEWTGEPGNKVKHTFARADGKPLWFAGLWDRCKTSDAGEVTSFTILTGPSAGWLSDYHDRAPVIVEQADWLVWLDPEDDPFPLFSAQRPERFERRSPEPEGLL